MSRRGRALLGGVLGLAFYGWAGPRAADWMRQVRAEGARAFSAAEVEDAYAAAGLAPGPEVEAELRRIAACAEIEEGWNLLVAATLTAPQRARALELGRSVPPSAPTGDERVVEPEVQALAREILQRHGFGEAEVGPAPTRDPWPGVDRRTRARAVLGLLRAGEIDAAQAHQLLRVTLDALDAQVERTTIERGLRERLPAAVQAAALAERAKRPDPLLGGAP